jgi:tRNA(fMet)-specific endonuclease VapC
MGLILDTSYFIRAERLGFPTLIPEAQEGEAVGASVVTLSELYVGVHRAASPLRRKKREDFIEGILSEVRIFDFTIDIAKLHSRLFAGLSARGALIGAHDLIIAATAVHLGWAVKTANEGEFRRIEGLEVLSL